jgi:hypothetical protein
MAAPKAGWGVWIALVVLALVIVINVVLTHGIGTWARDMRVWSLHVQRHLSDPGIRPLLQHGGGSPNHIQPPPECPYPPCS